MPHTSQTRSTTPPPASSGDLQKEISNAIQDANQAVRDQAQAQRDAALAVRDAKHALNGVPAIPPIPPIPGYSIQDPYDHNAIPPQAVEMAIGFFIMCAVIAIGWPLARAFGRRIERKGERAAVNPAMTDQLQRIEQAVDAMSIEIERISEAQRFMARLQNAQTPDQSALPVERR